jgi:hypothetical protein
MFDFLKQRKYIRVSLTVYQIGTILWLLLLVPYVAWEVFWYVRVGEDAIKWHTWVVGTITIIWILLAPVSVVDFIRKNILLGAFYIVLCILIGEVHPFTKVSMYNKFVNYAYAFKLTDSNDSIIPIKQNFDWGAGALSHKYSNFMAAHHFEYGNNVESDSSLQLAGKQLLTELKRSKKLKVTIPDSLKLYLVSYSLAGDSVIEEQKLLYADKSAK